MGTNEVRYCDRLPNPNPNPNPNSNPTPTPTPNPNPKVRYCDEDIAFLRDALDGLPPDLALLPTPLGPLRGAPC